MVSAVFRFADIKKQCYAFGFSFNSVLQQGQMEKFLFMYLPQ